MSSSVTGINSISSNCRSVCRMRVSAGDLTGVGAEDLVDFYLGSWAKGTLAMYKVALGRVIDFGVKIKKSVFLWREGEVAGLLVDLGKGEFGEAGYGGCQYLLRGYGKGESV